MYGNVLCLCYTNCTAGDQTQEYVLYFLLKYLTMLCLNKLVSLIRQSIVGYFNTIQISTMPFAKKYSLTRPSTRKFSMMCLLSMNQDYKGMRETILNNSNFNHAFCYKIFWDKTNCRKI